eukprot:g808.t1
MSCSSDEDETDEDEALAFQDIDSFSKNHGKGKFINPLLSSSTINSSLPSPKKERVIICFDLDCFYAQVAISENPKLRNEPVAIRQKYIIVTCNYEARKFGVKKLEGLQNARKKCPQLHIIDGSDLTPFRQASQQINALWREIFPPKLTIMQRCGMDETFIDITKLIDAKTEELQSTSVDSNNISTPNFQGHVIGSSEHESKHTLQRLAMASILVSNARSTLYKRLGYTCTGGIGTGKIGAKFGAEANKPNQQTTIFPSMLQNLIANKSIRSIQGVGRKTRDCLVESYRNMFKHHNFKEHHTSLSSITSKHYLAKRDVQSGSHPSGTISCAEVRAMGYNNILTSLDNNVKVASFVWNAVRGIDNEKLIPSSTLYKTISQEETSLPHPKKMDEARSRVQILASRLFTMIQERLKTSGEVPETLRLTLCDKMLFSHPAFSSQHEQRSFSSENRNTSPHSKQNYSSGQQQNKKARRWSKRSKQMKLCWKDMSEEHEFKALALKLLSTFFVKTFSPQNGQRFFHLARINLAVTNFITKPK